MKPLAYKIRFRVKIFITLLVFFSNTVFSQIPAGYYNMAEGLTGQQLKSALHEIIKDHKKFPYSSSSTDTWDILKATDKDTLNPDNVILFYSGWSINAAQEYNNSQGWNREHVWAKSHGDFGTGLGPGTDAHHLRPSDISVNSERSNKDFDDGGEIYIDYDGATECKTDADSWEPGDNIKGDVARMLFYMATRYEGESGEPDLELVDAVNTIYMNEPGKGYHGKLSALLKWHKNDPVSSFEMNRNNVIYSYQLNRNPFIDHPEFVSEIWSIPTRTSVNLKKKTRVYPNPAIHEVNIEMPNNETGLAELYSANGKIITSFVIHKKYKLSTSDITSGIYILHIINNKSVYQTKLSIIK
jgi:endonuclease I